MRRQPGRRRWWEEPEDDPEQKANGEADGGRSHGGRVEVTEDDGGTGGKMLHH